MSDMTVPTGWKLLHSPLPKAALRELPRDVYGVSGLTDVNEGYLIQRLFASGLSWSWRIIKQEFIAAEDRAVRDKDYTNRYYSAAIQGRLTIDGQIFDGSGASDNRKVDAAFKGASTVAFKNACKWAGLTSELYTDGRAIDWIYDFREAQAGNEQRPSSSPSDPTTASSVAVGQPASAPPTDGRRGPRAKRSNVVGAPPAATVAATASQVPSTSSVPPDLLDGPDTPTQPADEGKQAYLASQRQLIREAAAELSHVNAVLRNALERPIDGKPLEVVPPRTPSAESEAALGRLLASAYPGKNFLQDLTEEELAALLARFESNLQKKYQQMTDNKVADVG